MKIIAINGSPRKGKNTASMCESFLSGAASVSTQIETELINLSDLHFSGCISCFGCKLKKSGSYGKCIVRDNLSPVLEQVSTADGIAFASPIYLDDVTGMMRCFFERLLFPFTSYEMGHKKIAPKRMPTAMIYTMNVTKEDMMRRGYDVSLSYIESKIAAILSKPELIYSFNTYQFDDYSKYKVEIFSQEEKAEHRRLLLPLERRNAFDAGRRMAEQALGQ